MSVLQVHDQAFLERLNRHPHLRERIDSLLAIADNGDIVKADDAEQQIVEGIRQLGHDLLTDWATTRIERLPEHEGTRAGQKNSTGTAPSAQSMSSSQSSASSTNA